MVKCKLLIKNLFVNFCFYSVSARQIIEAGEFTRLSEHTWLLESELELIDEAVSKIEALMYLPKPDTIKQALELRTNLKALRHGSSNYKRFDFKTSSNLVVAKF